VIAIRKANFRLIKETERALDTMIADGTLEAIIDRWLQAPGDEQTNRSEYAHPEC
jgi:ABC-type amino acid transport substrate-binding protein